MPWLQFLHINFDVYEMEQTVAAVTSCDRVSNSPEILNENIKVCVKKSKNSPPGRPDELLIQCSDLARTTLIKCGLEWLYFH